MKYSLYLQEVQILGTRLNGKDIRQGVYKDFPKAGDLVVFHLEDVIRAVGLKLGMKGCKGSIRNMCVPDNAYVHNSVIDYGFPVRFEHDPFRRIDFIIRKQGLIEIAEHMGVTLVFAQEHETC